MAAEHITIADAAPRVQYAVGVVAQSSFAVPFPFFDLTDIEVYVAADKKTYGFDYNVTGILGRTGGYPGGTVELVAGVNNTTVTILRRVPLARSTDFPEAGKFNIRALNTQLDKLVAISQQLRDESDRTVKLAPTALVGAVTLETPVAGNYLKYDSTGTRIIATAVAPGGGGGGGGLPAIGSGQAYQLLRANASGTGYELASEFRGEEFKIVFQADAGGEALPILAIATEAAIARVGTLNGIRFRAPLETGGVANFAGINLEVDNIGSFTRAGKLYIDAYLAGGLRTRIMDFGDPIIAHKDLTLRVTKSGAAGAAAILRMQNIRTGGALANDYVDIRAQFRNQLNQTVGFCGWSAVCEDPTLGAESYHYDFWLYRNGVGKARWRFRDGLHHPDLANKGDGTINGKGLFINDKPVESGMLMRAWVRCDSAGAIVASHNVDSVTVLGTGRRRINFLNDFGSANYGFAFGLQEAAAANQSIGIENGTSPAAGSIDVALRNSAGTLTDLAFSGFFGSEEADAPAEQAAAATAFDLVTEAGIGLTAEDGTQLVIDQ